MLLALPCILQFRLNKTFRASMTTYATKALIAATTKVFCLFSMSRKPDQHSLVSVRNQPEAQEFNSTTNSSILCCLLSRPPVIAELYNHSNQMDLIWMDLMRTATMKVHYLIVSIIFIKFFH